MHAVRVPLLGIAVAVALLLVETVGAIAYREHAIASVAAADQQTAPSLAKDAEQRVHLEAIQQRVHHCNE